MTMAILTQSSSDRKLLLKIIGGFGEGNYKVSPEMAEKRHVSRMIMLVRWTFLRYCEKHKCNELSLVGFYDLQRATIGMWMDEPYMKLYKNNGEDRILFQYSVDFMKELYLYIKSLK